MDWDSETNNFKNLTIIHELLPAFNSYHHKLNHDKTTSTVDRKKLEESLASQKAHLDDRAINNMFDVVVLTGNTSSDVHFLEHWKTAVQHVHIIIIQQGDPDRFVAIPEWADFELYTSRDVERAVGKDAWLFDMAGDSSAAANFGFIVSDRHFVYVLDRDCVPISEVSSAGEVVLSELFRSHANNLMRPSTPYYYNNHDPFLAASEQGSTADYVRGFPYSLREGVQTAVSYGSVKGLREFDSLTRLMKPDGIVGEASGATTSKDEHSSRKREIVHTVGKGSLFSLRLRDVAFNRKTFGHAFALFSAAHNKVHFPIGDNYEVIAGWAMKKLADHVGLGIKHVASPYHLEYRPVNNSTEAVRAQLFEEMKGDLLWLETHEAAVRWFSSVELSGKSRDDLDAAVHELGTKMINELHAVHPVFTEIGNILLRYCYLFNMRNGFHASYLPISSRSSKGPSPASPHQCAAFTIVHNETAMMSVWLRYYGKHLPGAVWVLNHHSGGDDRANQVHVDWDIVGSKVPVHVEQLWGDSFGFPMGFFIGQADLYQRRFLRYGYKCVVLSDVDEMLVPDPEKYPLGLSQYLASFVNNSATTVFRAEGHIIAHISTPDGTENLKIEPPIDFAKPILAQRHFYYPQPRYSKPLVSKIPLHYKPGFHTTFTPAVIQCDTDLKLFHLRDVDKDFCLAREYQKFQLMRNAHQSEIDLALNGHILQYETMVKKGETCQFAQSTYYKKYGGAFENLGKVKLVDLPEKWNSAVV